MLSCILPSLGVFETANLRTIPILPKNCHGVPYFFVISCMWPFRYAWASRRDRFSLFWSLLPTFPTLLGELLRGWTTCPHCFRGHWALARNSVSGWSIICGSFWEQSMVLTKSLERWCYFLWCLSYRKVRPWFWSAPQVFGFLPWRGQCNERSGNNRCKVCDFDCPVTLPWKTLWSKTSGL